MNRPVIRNEEDVQWFKAAWGNTPTFKIAEHFGVSTTTIRHAAKRYGLGKNEFDLVYLRTIGSSVGRKFGGHNKVEIEYDVCRSKKCLLAPKCAHYYPKGLNWRVHKHLGRGVASHCIITHDHYIPKEK